ncbi:MAG TPA: energy transducer TonB [Thermoanaerobaculia bacterium]|nr:energy transducer TonB [Thermoanaerobaculia bacterium]
MQPSRRLSLFAAFLFSLVGLGQGAVPSAAKILTLPVPEWTAIGAEADRALRAGSWELGRDAAERLISQILSRPAQGQGLDTLLARSVAYRAIGLAGVGKTEASAWAAATARELGFRAKDLDLSAYGKPGEMVRAALDPAPVEAEPLQVGNGISRPQIVERTSPFYPLTLREALVGGTVIVDAVIGLDGKTRTPHVLHSPSIFLSLAALDSLQSWRFTPAQREGKPIAVSYVLTVNFSIDPPQPQK